MHLINYVWLWKRDTLTSTTLFLHCLINRLENVWITHNDFLSIFVFCFWYYVVRTTWHSLRSHATYIICTSSWLQRWIGAEKNCQKVEWGSFDSGLTLGIKSQFQPINEFFFIYLNRTVTSGTTRHKKVNHATCTSVLHTQQNPIHLFLSPSKTKTRIEFIQWEK